MNVVHLVPDEQEFADLYKNSEWVCYLFGTKDFSYRPRRGGEPNWFWRWMQYLILGNRWVKDD